MKINKKTPQLRFKGFSDEWEMRKLGEVGDTYTGLSGKSKDDFGHGKGRFITYMNVFSNPIGLPEMTDAVEIDNSQNKVLKGDVFFTTSSETPEEVGMSSVWIENSENTYLNSFCFGYRPIEYFNSHYLAYMLRSTSIRKKITFLAQGISRYNISKNKMMEIDIPIPNLKEQQKIGSFFQNLDNLITLNQCKYDKLINIKKSCLEKMFPKDGATVPEIRFKGFTGEWEQLNVFDIADIIGGGTPDTSNSSYWDGDIDWYTPAELGNKIYADSSERKITELGLQKCSANILPADTTILFTSRASIGKTAVLRNSACTNQGFQSLVLKENIIPYFIYSMSAQLKNKAEAVASGSTFAEISGKMLGNIKIMMPTVSEQKVIGGYFQSLDNLITQQKTKIEKLKNIKKSCLEKMFI